MTLQKQITFWVVSFLVLILVLWLLSPILLPFIAGLYWLIFSIPSPMRWSASACRG